MDVSMEQAYNEACRLLGESLVKQAFTEKALRQAIEAQQEPSEAQESPVEPLR